MTVYASYNPASGGVAPVLAFYDTSVSAASLPATSSTLALYTLTANEAQERFAGAWGVNVSAPALTAITLTMPAPTLTQQAAAAINAGVAITSTGTPALSATYACNEAAQARLNRVSVYLQVNGAFPNGATTIQWVDATGTPHTFTEAQFKTLAVAIADYVSALDDVILGLSSAMPSSAVTIA